MKCLNFSTSWGAHSTSFWAKYSRKKLVDKNSIATISLIWVPSARRISGESESSRAIRHGCNKSNGVREEKSIREARWLSRVFRWQFRSTEKNQLLVRPWRRSIDHLPTRLIGHRDGSHRPGPDRVAALALAILPACRPPALSELYTLESQRTSLWMFEATNYYSSFSLTDAVRRSVNAVSGSSCISWCCPTASGWGARQPGHDLRIVVLDRHAGHNTAPCTDGRTYSALAVKPSV